MKDISDEIKHFQISRPNWFSNHKKRMSVGWFPSLTTAYDKNGRWPRQKYSFWHITAHYRGRRVGGLVDGYIWDTIQLRFIARFNKTSLAQERVTIHS